MPPSSPIRRPLLNTLHLSSYLKSTFLLELYRLNQFGSQVVIPLDRAVAWFDGASQQGGELCGAGGKLILNAHSSISWMINCRPGSNTKAELIGAWTSLILAHRHTDNLLLLGDSKLIIDWLKGVADFQVAALNSWKERTKDATLLFRNLTFQHIFREANKEADTLSKKALHLTPNQIFYTFWVDGHKGNSYKLNL
jgi:ribonuclease HI